MKAFPWLLFLAFEVVCLTSCPIAGLTESVYRDAFKGSGFPTWTRSVFFAQNWLWAFPLPWLVYSVILTRKMEPPVSSLLMYAGSISVGCSVFLSWLIGGLLMPYYLTHIFVTVHTVIGH